MFKGNDANRIARERSRQNRMNEKKRQAEELRRAKAQGVIEIREIKAEIKRTLELLEKLGYPYMVNLRVRRRIRSAWLITSRETWHYDAAETVNTYLLSNGSLYDGTIEFSKLPIRALKGPYKGPNKSFRQKILEGLSYLRGQLEDDLKKVSN